MTTRYPIGTVLRNIDEPKNKLILLAYVDNDTAIYKPNYMIHAESTFMPQPHDLLYPIAYEAFWEVDEESTLASITQLEVKVWLEESSNSGNKQDPS